MKNDKLLSFKWVMPGIIVLAILLAGRLILTSTERGGEQKESTCSLAPAHEKNPAEENRSIRPIEPVKSSGFTSAKPASSQFRSSGKKEPVTDASLNEFAIPPSPEGEPGVTWRQLRVLHARQMLEAAERNSDLGEILVPASKDGSPAVTRRELQDFHVRQMRETAEKNSDPNEILVQSSPDGSPALTRQELNALHARQMQEAAERSSDPDAMVVKPSEDGSPELTRRELQELHAMQMKGVY